MGVLKNMILEEVDKLYDSKTLNRLGFVKTGNIWRGRAGNCIVEIYKNDPDWRFRVLFNEKDKFGSAAEAADEAFLYVQTKLNEGGILLENNWNKYVDSWFDAIVSYRKSNKQDKILDSMLAISKKSPTEKNWKLFVNLAGKLKSSGIRNPLTNHIGKINTGEYNKQFKKSFGKFSIASEIFNLFKQAYEYNSYYSLTEGMSQKDVQEFGMSRGYLTSGEVIPPNYIKKIIKSIDDLKLGIISDNDLLNTFIRYKKLNPKLYDKLTEGRRGIYHEYRDDDTKNPRQKIGHALRNVRDRLTEIEKIIDLNLRLKQETGIKNSDYWKNTHKSMKRIFEKLLRLQNKLRRF